MLLSDQAGPTTAQPTMRTADGRTVSSNARRCPSSPLVTATALVTPAPLHRMTPRTTVAHERRRARERLLAALLAAPQLRILHPQLVRERRVAC